MRVKERNKLWQMSRPISFAVFFFVFVSVHSVSVIFNAALYASPLAGVWSAFLEFMSHRERLVRLEG